MTTRKSTPWSAFALRLPSEKRRPGSRLCLLPAMVLAMVLAGVATGCGKKAEPPAPAAAVPAQEPPGPAPKPGVARKPAQPQTLKVQEGASSDAVLQQLNRELLRWVVAHRRRPASYEEFISSARLTVPPPPAGKRYVLGRDMKIVLK